MSGHRPRRRQRDPRPTVDTHRAVHTPQGRSGGGHQRGQHVRSRQKTRANGQHSRTELNVQSLQPLKIKEVPPEEYEESIESLGTVQDWREQLEFLEKARMRPYITCAVLGLWAATMIACIIELFLTRTFLVMIMPELLGIPVAAILRFYYRWPPPRGGKKA